MGKVPANFHGKPGRSGRKTIREEVTEYKAAEALFYAEQDQEVLESKIRSGKFRVADRFLLTAMEGDSRILAKAADKAIPNAGEDDKGKGNITFQFIKFGEDDSSHKNTVSVRSIDKTIPDGNMETPRAFQIIDSTSESG